MKKKLYIIPQIESYLYQAEEGYLVTVALQKDYVLIEGNDNTTLRLSDELTEMTSTEGEYDFADWDLTY